MMRPAVDREGRVWFGEMNRNYLAVFDPRTRAFRQMTPPHGHYGIMGVAVAGDDSIWFAEQYANYIGHYLPATGRYQTYPLPTITVPDPSNAGKTLTLPVAPNDLAIDVQGIVWFTEMNADAIGRLDPHSGHLRHYPISARRSAQTLNPYGVTIDPRGMVWFTESSTNRVGQLDPATGSIHFFSTPGAGNLMELASDSRGTLWLTSFRDDLLLSLNPRTGTFTPYYAPSSGSGTGGLYGLAVTPADEVWITVPAENVIAHLDITAHRFIYYHIPTTSSFPLGIAIDNHQHLWFTESGSNKVGMLQP